MTEGTRSQPKRKRRRRRKKGQKGTQSQNATQCHNKHVEPYPDDNEPATPTRLKGLTKFEVELPDRFAEILEWYANALGTELNDVLKEILVQQANKLRASYREANGQSSGTTQNLASYE